MSPFWQQNVNQDDRPIAAAGHELEADERLAGSGDAGQQHQMARRGGRRPSRVLGDPVDGGFGCRARPKNGAIHAHVCVRINGLGDLKPPRNLALEAFAHQAVDVEMRKEKTRMGWDSMDELEAEPYRHAASTRSSANCGSSSGRL